MFKRLIASLVCLSFIFSNFQLSYAQSGPLYSGEFSVNQLPVPGKMLGVSETFTPILVKGLIVHPDQPLNFDFIVDSGNDTTDQAVIKEQSEKIVKYFLAALTVPENSLWVNLSPYEKDRIIDQNLGQTLLGRDMLAEDYVLKQLTASMIYPEDKLGKDFWSKIYKEAQKKFGTTDIPVSTFNKVWIVPQKAEVFEKDNAVYVTQASLKVMLESDYMAMSKNTAVLANPDALKGDKKGDLTKNIIRQLVLPAIEKEVNQGRNFATLRQVYYAAILAKWYRALIQGTLMSQAYVGTNKILGVNNDDKTVKEQIYQRYIAAYKKGVFNYIKEDNNILTGERIPRKYFSGGEILARIPMTRSSGQGLDRSSTGKIFKVEFAMKPDRDEPDALPASEKQEIRGRITGMLENGQWDLVVGEIKRAREAMEFSVFWGNSPGTSTREWNYSMQHSNNVMETIVDTIRTSDKKDQFFQSQAWLTSKETVKIKVPRIYYISTRKEYEQMYIRLERAVPVMLLNSDKVYPEDRSASLFDYKRVIMLKDPQGDEYVFQISYSDNNYGHIYIYFTPQSAIPIPFTTVGVGFILDNMQIYWPSLTWEKAIERSVSEYKARFVTQAMQSSDVTPEDVATKERFEAKLKEFAAASDWMSYKDLLVRAMEVKLISNKEQLKEPLQRLETGDTLTEYLDVMFRAVELRVISRIRYRQLRRPLSYMVRMALLADEFGTMEATDQCWNDYRHVILKALELNVFTNKEQLKEALKNLVDHVEMNGEIEQKVAESGVMGRAADLGENRTLSDFETTVPKDQKSLFVELQELANEEDGDLYSELLLKALELKEITKDEELKGPLKTLSDAGRWDGYLDVLLKAAELKVISHLDYDELMKPLRKLRAAYSYEGWHREAPVNSRKNETSGYTKTVLKALELRIISHEEQLKEPLQELADGNRWDEYFDVVFKAIELKIMSGYNFEQLRKPLETLAAKGYRGIFVDLVQKAIELKVINNYEQLNETLGLTPAIEGQDLDGESVQHFFLDESSYFEVISTALRLKVINNKGRLQELLRGEAARSISRRYHQRIVAQAIEVGLIKSPGEITQAMRTSQEAAQSNPFVSENGGIDIKDIKLEETSSGRRIRFNDAAMKAIFNGEFNGFSPVFKSITSVESPMSVLGAGSVQGPQGALTKA